MKLLIDANIILDVLQKREPYYEYSAIIWKLCETGKTTGYVSVLTFMNIVYILRKELTSEKIEEIYKALSLIFSLEDLKEEDVKHALMKKQYLRMKLIQQMIIISKKPLRLLTCPNTVKKHDKYRLNAFKKEME